MKLLLKTAMALLLTVTAPMTIDSASAACNVKCDASDKGAVCGSDSKTYQNACLLAFAQCDNAALTLQGKGTCEEVAEAKKKKTVRIHAKISSNGKEAAACSQDCTRELDPVCGDDGKTYSNKCLFEYAKCLNPALTLKSEDACPPKL